MGGEEVGGNRNNKKTIKMREELYISVQIYQFFLMDMVFLVERGLFVVIVVVEGKIRER